MVVFLFFARYSDLPMPTNAGNMQAEYRTVEFWLEPDKDIWMHFPDTTIASARKCNIGELKCK